MLDFLNNKNRLIYTGHVVAMQGESTPKASKLNIDLEKTASSVIAPADSAAPAAGNGSVRHMEADGPVTMVSKDQVGTGDHAAYDKAESRVFLTGNVTLTQGSTVIQGDSSVYDVPSGQARAAGDVRSVPPPGNNAGRAGAGN